jgi:hypothetical protein
MLSHACQSVFLSLAKFCQILTYTKVFSWENMTQICQISKKQKSQIVGFLWKSLVGSQEHDKFYFHI